MAGLRHEKHSLFGSETLPRVGLILNPSDTMAVKFSTGKHFAAPTMNDLFWPDDGFSKGNAALKPEIGWHSDATIEHSFSDEKLFFTLSVFTWDIKDKISWAETSEPTIVPGYFYWTPSNVDAYEAVGGEAGIRLGPFYSSILSLNYTYTDAKERIQDGVERQALYSPEQLFKGDYTYYAPFGLMTKIIARYVDERPGYYESITDEDPVFLDAYWTVDLKFEQQIFGHWVFSLQCNNLFDETYYTRSASFFDQTTFESSRTGFPGAGRSVFFSVSYEL